MTTNWPRQDFPALAAQGERARAVQRRRTRAGVASPTRTALAEIAAMFTASPRFVINEQAGAGHNISLCRSVPPHTT